MHLTLSRFASRGDDPTGARASVGHLTGGPATLVRELSLRLGLPQDEADDAARAVSLLERARALAHSGPAPFFARSLAVDPTGTAAALLRMRDALVEAGWRGEPVPGGGPRLDDLARLEALGPTPPGAADRVAAAVDALAGAPCPLFERISLTEPAHLWPGAFRRAFELLAAQGTVVEELSPTFPGAAPTTDLGRAQAALVAPRRGDTPPPLRGDGSLVLLSAPTSWELGEGVAALLRARARVPATDALVVRLGDAAPLEAALVAQGLGGQGLSTPSALRPALQLLPLALSLRFAPRDVHHTLELLSLPISPIPAAARAALLRALSDVAGVGSAVWRAAVVELDEAARARVATFVEPRAFPRDEGAPPEVLLETVDALAGWARARLTLGEERGDEGLGALLGALGALRAVLLVDHRARLLPHEVDLAVASVLSPSAFARSVERAGRPDHVADPAAVLRSRPLVVVWHAGVELAVPPRDPFRVAERRALDAAGVRLPAPIDELEARAVAARRAVLAATEALVVATADTHLGAPQPLLPVWDEIVARLGLSRASLSRVTARTRDLCADRARWATAGQQVGEALAPLPLPAADRTWQIDASAAALAERAARRLSASGLEALLGCPLRFVLDRAAGLRAARVSSVSAGALLSGRVGHRFVEELVHAELLGRPDAIEEEGGPLLDRLLEEEGAPLHRVGRGAERAQARAAILEAARSLAALVTESGLSVEAVEAEVEHASDGETLTGRIDLLLADAAGRPFVLDLKFGASTYREKLERGQALQLVHYAEVLRRSRSLPELPEAAYFSLRTGRAFALRDTILRGPVTPTRGPSLAQVGRDVARATEGVRALLADGEIPVTGVGSPSHGLGAALAARGGAPTTADRWPPEVGCEHCAHGALCGRAWEARS